MEWLESLTSVQRILFGMGVGAVILIVCLLYMELKG